MGDRRRPSLLNQTTFASEPPPPPVEDPVATDASPVDPEPDPRPVVYPPVKPSSEELQARQMRWLRERDRRAAATRERAPSDAP
jgi:hypothetical protein